MTRNPKTAWLNEDLVPWDEAVIPIEDRGLLFGESLYEVLPVTAGKVRLLGEHCQRMRAGAEVLGFFDALPEDTEIDRIAALLVAEEQVDEGLLYVQVTGGTAPRSHIAQHGTRPTFFAYLRPHRFPTREEVARGICAATVADARWARCDLKTTMLLPAVLAKRQADARGADEALIVGPGGAIHEGASSNLFVCIGGRLLYPGHSHRLLAGTMAPLAITLGADAGIQALPTTLTVEQLWSADEVFLTSTSRLAMPVIEVDARAIADRTPGPVATELARRLRAHLELDAT
jgi:D-alanine transaminase